MKTSSKHTPLMEEDEDEEEEDDEKTTEQQRQQRLRREYHIRFWLLLWSLLPLFFVFFLSQQQSTNSTRTIELSTTTIATTTTTTTTASTLDKNFISAFPNALYNNNNYNKDCNCVCTPRKLHLSQASNVLEPNDDDKHDNDNTALVNFTLSFMVSSAHSECRTAKPHLIYGRKSGDDDKNNNITVEGVVTESELVHFDYVSTPNNGEEYSSDWIHHMVIPNIQAGRVKYWYRVVMVDGDGNRDNDGDDDNDESSSLSLASPLLKKLERTPASIFDRVFMVTTMKMEEDEDENDGDESSSSSLVSLASLLLELLEKPAADDIYNSNHHQNNNLLRKGIKSHYQHSAATTLTITTAATTTILGNTPWYPFWTTPKYDQPTSLALVGDLGQTENSTKTMHHIYQATQSINGSSSSISSPPPVSALLIAGDMSYANGDPHLWERWFELMEPLLRSTPLQVAAGNHEIECDNRTSDIFVPYESYFRNPNRIAKAEMWPVSEDYRKTLWMEECLTSSVFMGHYNYGNSFYSFTHGLAHVVVLNSYTETLPGSVQYEWLDKELATHKEDRVIKGKSPWLLVMFHCPLHTTFIGHNGESNPFLMLHAMEPLFVKYNVNFVISGHDHGYMRTTPMVGIEKAAPTLDGAAPIYLTLGAGGNKEGHAKGYLNPDEAEEWVAKRDNEEYGYGHLFLANHTHAKLDWVRDGTTEDGIQDSVWVENYIF